MSSIGRLFRLVLTLVFVFSMIPAALFYEASPVDASSGWMKYPGNMSLNDKYVLDSTVIKDGATYKMWYTRLSFDTSVTTLFSNVKGLNLAALITAFQNDQFNTFLNNLAGLNTPTSTTALWTILNGTRTVIGYAESTDGKNWTNIHSNVLPGTNGNFFTSVGSPSVVRIDSTHYKMWYTSLQSTLDQATLTTIFNNMANDTPATRRVGFDALLNSTKTVIKYATSSDGFTSWTPTGAPALSAGSSTPGIWSALDSVSAPSVIMDGTTYKMWYTRVKTDINSVALDTILGRVATGTFALPGDLLGILDGSALVIGYATSSDDGVTFTVANDKVLPGSSIPNPAFWQSATDPCVIKTGSTYEIWYTNGVTNLTSSPLTTVISQIKALNIPALWTSLQTKSLTDFIVDLTAINTTSLQTSLNGTSAVIGYATGSDGQAWTVSNASELAGAATTPWSSVAGPSVVKSSTMSEMWYTQGISALTFQNFLDRVLGVTVSVGYASTKVLTSLVITAPTNTVAAGNNVQFTATGTYNDNTTANLTSAPGIVWTSSNASKATINTTGLAHSVAVGTTTITATYGTFPSNEFSLNVSSAILTGIAVTPANGTNPSVAKGRTQQFTATGTYSDMSTAIITNIVTWTSSSTGTATIGANTGLAQSVAVGGPVTITASFVRADNVTISGTSTLAVTSAVYDYLLITPDNPSVAVGDDIQLTATAYLTDGTPVSATTGTTWISSDPTKVANPPAGLAHGSATTGGTPVTITATYTYNSVTKSDTTLITVLPARVTALRITDASPHVAAGVTASSSLSLVIDNSTPATNVPLASNAAGVTWASLNTAIATVSANGTVTGVAAGTVTIRATYLGFIATVTFTVDNPNLTGVMITPANTTIPAGAGNVQYTATGMYTDSINRVLPNAINTSIAWSVTTTTGTTIGATTGLLVPGTTGAVTVIATASIPTGAPAVGPGSTGLTITSALLDTITISAVPNLSVPKGKTRQLIATGTYVGGATADITSMITSWVSATPANVSVSSSGMVTASGLATSTSVMTATYGGRTGTATVTVAAPDLMSIAITPANPSIAKGRTQQFVATGAYSDSTTAVITTTVSWTSGTPGVANIGAATGLTTAAASVGTTVITASFTRPSDSVIITNSATLTVNPAVLTSIAVTSPGGLTVAAGSTLALVATGTYSDTSTAVITNAVSWSSSNPAFASVATNGTLTSYVPGAVTITASLDNIPGTLAITVGAATVSSVTVDPVGAVIAKGTTRQFRAIANYTDGTKVDVTASATWTSDSALATVSNTGTKGIVTGVNKGAPNPNITATYNAVPGSVSVIITDATLNSIAVTPTTSVAAGKTQQFTATGSYSDASFANITNMVTWSSNNTTVATIESGGLATSYIPGSATISATMPAPYAGLPGTAVLTVTAAVLDRIALTPDVTPVNPQVTFISGAPPTVQFKATGVFSDGSTSVITNTVNWTSSITPGVASIGLNTGLALTGGTAGTTVITATDPGTGKIATSALTVLADTVAPVIKITSPKEGVTTNDKNLTVTGNIDDVNVTLKQYILNGGAPVTFPIDSSGNFSIGMLLNNGNNTISVKAIDVDGNTGESETVSVNVDAKKPAIIITSPTDGSLTNNAAVTIAGTVTLATQVNVIVNGISTPVAVTGGAFTTTATLSAGDNIICVTAYDSTHTGDADYLGASGSRMVTLDITPPVVAINTPVNNSYVGTAGAVVSGTVDDPGVTTARLILNGSAPLTIGVEDGQFRQSIGLAQGTNTIIVQATDEAGNTSLATPRTVTVDTSKPDVVLTTPTNNLRTNAASQLVSGTVNDPSITTVALYVNGVLDTIPVAPGGTFSKMKSLNNGNNTIEVRATDATANTGSSGVANVIVDTVSPILTIGLTDPRVSIEITVISNETLSVAPIVTVNATPVVTTMSDINTYIGTYVIPIAGDYTVTASGTDLAGNKGTITASFTKETIMVNGTVPTPVTSEDTTLQVQTNGAVTGDISVTTSLQNPSGNVNNPGGAALGAGAFVDITASSELQNNLKQIYIQVNYDPAQLPSGTDQSTLRLYLWDVASGVWQIVPGSGVNTTDHYIYGTLTHLSQYGGFGTTTVVVPPVLPPVLPAGTTSVASSVLVNGQFTAAVTARSDDNLASVTIPLNTIGRTSSGVALSVITIVKMTVPPAAPTNNAEVGPVYNFGPDGATFSPAVTVSFPYTDSQIPAGADVNKMAIYFRDSTGNWTKLESVVNTTNHTVTAQTTHFTSFAILVPTAPAAFTASGITISPSEVKIGEQVTISVKITNSGDLGGTYKATLKVNNTTAETKDVVIAGGASSTVTFTTSKNVAGTYSVAIDNQTGQFIVKEAIVPTTTPTTTPTTPTVPAAFTISNLSVTPATVDINGNVTISVQVSNSGDSSGTYEVKLKIDNVVTTSKSVTVAAKSSQIVTFTTTKDKAGTYTVGIEGLTSFFTVKVPPTTPTTTPPVKPTGTNWALIGGIVGGIVVIAAVLVMVMMIRRKK